MMHLFRLGREHGRVFFVCRKSSFNNICKFRQWFDESLHFELPCCKCPGQKQMVLRKVMGLRDNGRYFAQCALKECKYRVWLVPSTDRRRNNIIQAKQLPVN